MVTAKLRTSATDRRCRRLASPAAAFMRRRARVGGEIALKDFTKLIELAQ